MCQKKLIQINNNMENLYNSDRIINVLIPDGERVLALNVINCLSVFKHVNIFVLSKKKWTETRFSKNINSFHYLVKERTEKEWIEIIKGEIIKNKIDVLFPVEIENIRVLSKYNEQFRLLVPNLLLPPVNSFDIANNKWNLYEFLKINFINSPKTFYGKEFLKRNDTTLEFPVLLKPLVGMGGFGIKKIYDNESLTSLLQSDDDYIIQNFIKGFDIDMSVLCEKGKILAFTIQKGYIFSRSQYSAPFGVEFLFENELYEMIEKLMKKLQWSGFAHIDLMYDELEKNFKVIEINPRIWGSVEASEKVGINFPFFYCLSSLKLNYEIPEYRFEKCVNNTGLIKILKSKLKISKDKYRFPENATISNDIVDPLPILFKALYKRIKHYL